MLELVNRTALGAVGETLVGSSPTIYIAREYCLFYDVKE